MFIIFYDMCLSYAMTNTNTVNINTLSTIYISPADTHLYKLPKVGRLTVEMKTKLCNIFCWKILLLMCYALTLAQWSTLIIRYKIKNSDIDPSVQLKDMITHIAIVSMARWILNFVSCKMETVTVHKTSEFCCSQIFIKRFILAKE